MQHILMSTIIYIILAVFFGAPDLVSIDSAGPDSSLHTWPSQRNSPEVLCSLFKTREPIWGFRKWRYPNRWMVYDGKSQSKMDDEQGYPHFRKPPTGTTGKTGQHYILLNYGWSQIPFPSPGLREIPVADWNMSRLIYIYIHTHKLGAS